MDTSFCVAVETSLPKEGIICLVEDSRSANSEKRITFKVDDLEKRSPTIENVSSFTNCELLSANISGC